MSILEFFPHDGFRKFQKEAILDIQKAFDEGTEYIILESPTGSGKSAMGICLGLYNQPSFLLTSQKILQEQYVKDYISDQICVLKGRSNYLCSFWRKKANCSEGVCLVGKKCPHRLECEYNIAKSAALNSKVALMNYSYFLSSMEYTENFAMRNLLVCDECHNLESQLLGFIEINFSSYYLSKLGITSKIPVYDSTDKYVDWLNEILAKISKFVYQYTNQLENIEPLTINQEKILKIKQELDLLNGLKDKIEKLLTSYQVTEWIFDIVESKELKRQSINFKPLTVAFFANSSLFQYGNKKLLMSATILDKDNFCKTLGIPTEKALFLRLPSTFSTEIRPIILTNTGKMSKNDIDKTLPKIVTDIERMLEHHNNEKGLIHTHTYKITNYIKEHIDKKYSGRLIFHSSEDRESKFNSFLKSKGNEVFVTPSMTEGIDLKDDLARFVAIVKIPYLFLGDKQVRRRAELDESWYRWRAALTLVQASGRGVRHENDFCTIYVMDSGFRYFVKQNLKFFPDYFINSIKN